VLPRLTNLGRTALDLLFPRRCLGCGREGSLICPICHQKLPEIIPPICPRCGIPQARGMLCPTCSKHHQDIDGIRSPFRFEGIIRQAIHQLKYKNLRFLVKPLADLLINYLSTNTIPSDILVPVPLHRKRFKGRSYNQTGLLARDLGRIAKMPIVADILIRNKYTPTQARATSVSERCSNVADVFTCHNRSPKNKRVILVDDVATYEATFNTCASSLKTAGAISVWGLTLAREV